MASNCMTSSSSGNCVIAFYFKMSMSVIPAEEQRKRDYWEKVQNDTDEGYGENEDEDDLENHLGGLSSDDEEDDEGRKEEVNEAAGSSGTAVNGSSQGSSTASSGTNSSQVR